MNLLDMPNDIDFDAAAKPTVLDAVLAGQKFATAKTHAVFTEKCTRCGGSGRYNGASSYGRDCFKCRGAGLLEFKTSRDDRERARQSAADRAVRKADASLAAFAEDNPERHAWMVEKAPTFGFAASMIQAVRSYGSLTTNQLGAVDRMIAADRQRAAAQAAQAAKPAPAVDRLPALHEVMQRHAKFYAGDLTLARKNGDQLVWIKHRDAERVVGKLDNGVLTLWNRGVDNDAIRAVLVEFEGAPLQTAMKYGRLSGLCCSCGRDLTDEGSIEAGIGPVCARKFS